MSTLLQLHFLVFALWTQSVFAQVERQVVIPNHSPTISYEPTYGDGIDPATGWTIWTTENGFLPKLGQDALGDIYHITSRHDAQFSLSFYGTGISLSGMSNATYQVLVDDAELPVSGTGNLLFQTTNLELKDHLLVLKVTSDDEAQMVSFANATIATSSPKELKSIEYSFDSDQVHFTGNWTSMYTLDHGSVRRTSDLDASVSMTFSGARAIAIHSNLYFSRWLYDVELDSKMMFAPGNTGKQFNASILWTISDTILFFADNLDEGEHTVKMIHPWDEEFWSTTFRSFEVWRVESNGSDSLGSTPKASSHGNLSTGAYVGIGLGVLVGVVAAAAAYWFLLHRRRRRHLRLQYDGPIMTQGRGEANTQLPSPSPLVSSPTNGLHAGGTQSTALVYEPYHSSPSASDRKGGRMTAPEQVPEVQYVASPAQNGSDRTDEALPVVTSPPPAYGTGNGGSFPRS